MRARITSVLLLAGVLAACAEQGAGPERPAIVRSPLSLAPAIGVDSVTGASIETRQDDYAPGEVVHVVGKGWTPGETVNLYMTEEPDTHGPVSLDVVADSAGGFSVHFYDVQVHDLGSTFTLTATGATSGSKAVAVFTDGQIQASSVLASYRNPSCATVISSLQVGVEFCLRLDFRITGTGTTVYHVRWIRPNGTVAETDEASTTYIGTNHIFEPKLIPDAAGTWTVRLCETAASAVSPATSANCAVDGHEKYEATFTVAAGVTKLAFSTPARTSTVGACTSILTIQSQNASNVATNVTTNTIVALSSSSAGGSFYSDDTCSSAISQLTIAAGSNSASFYYKDSNSGNPTLTGTSAPLAPAVQQQTIDRGSATVTVSSSLDPSVFGQSVAFTATVSGAGATPTGNVDFYVGTSCSGTKIGATKSLSAGSATSDGYSSLPAGANNIIACYAGDGNYAGPVSGTYVQDVDKANVLVTMSATPDPSVFGESVALSATVTAVAPGAGTPTGAITYHASGTCTSPGTQIGSGTVAAPDASTTALAAGSYTLIACYAGDANFNAGGDDEAHEVSKATSSLDLTSSLNPSYFGNSVTFTATVTITDGVATPTGNVAFANGGTCNTATGTISGGMSLGSVALNASGIATLSTSALTAGTHTIVACYGGTANIEGSTDSESQVVQKAVTALALASNNDPSTFGENVTFTATISFTNGSATLTGQNVRFSVGGTCNTATGAITGGTRDLGTDALDGSNMASVTVNDLPAGTHTIVACYGGNSNVLGSTDDVAQQVDKVTTTITLTLDPSSQQYSDSTVFRASVTPSTVLTETLSGSVQFKVNNVNVGSPQSVTCDATTCRAVFSYKVASGIAASPLQVSAAFTSTNANFDNSTTASASPLTITREDATVFDLNVTPSQLLINQGGSITFKVRETDPELNVVDSLAAPGDISNAAVSVSAKGVLSPGNALSFSCGAPSSNGSSGYAEVLTVTCTFAGTPNADTYEATVDITGNHYQGSASAVIQITDPSLGFATGGGWYTMVNGDRVNFGFMAKATVNNRKTVYQGSLLVIRHTASGEIKAKSNVFEGYSIATVSTGGAEVSFSGKATYSVNGSSLGNFAFVGYGFDNATSGAGVDRFGLYLANPGNLVATGTTASGATGPKDTARTLSGGNIQVPQPSGGGKK